MGNQKLSRKTATKIVYPKKKTIKSKWLQMAYCLAFIVDHFEQLNGSIVMYKKIEICLMECVMEYQAIYY